VHPQVLIKSMRQSAALAVECVKGMAVPFEGDKGKEMLLKCAGTALNSKLISSHQVRERAREGVRVGKKAVHQPAFLRRAASERL